MATYKTDWNSSDFINFGDWNRIESNILELSQYLNSIQYPMPPLVDNKSALSFDGAGGYVNIGTWVQAALTNGLTMECWVKITADNGQPQTIMSNFDAGGFGFQYNTPTAPKKFMGMAHINGAYQMAWRGWEDVVLNRWYHLAYTYNGSQVAFYVDGIFEGSISVTGNIGAPTTGAPFVIGGNPNGTAPNPTEWLNGYVDEVRIWKYGRTQNDIKANMYNSLLGTELGLIGYWECNETTGTTLVARTGANGTLVGAGWTTDVPSVGAVTARTVKSIDFLSGINRIENNLGAIHAAFGMTPPNVVAKKTWTVGMGFSFDDVNRLENNTQILKTYGQLITQSYRYSGSFTCGDQGGLY